MSKHVLSVVFLVAMNAVSATASQSAAKDSQPAAKASGSESQEKGAATEEPRKDEGKKIEVAAVDPKGYKIGPEDVLMIRVWREPELSGQLAVRPDGKISLPLIGETQAAGFSPEALATSISTALTKYMTHPEVTVGVTQVNSRRYFIQGEVQKPGAYPLVVPTTVLEALVNAGGFRDFANTKKIRVMRGAQVFRFNYKEVTQGRHLDENILLQPGDQIIVP